MTLLLLENDDDDDDDDGRRTIPRPSNNGNPMARCFPATIRNVVAIILPIVLVQHTSGTGSSIAKGPSLVFAETLICINALGCAKLGLSGERRGALTVPILWRSNESLILKGLPVYLFDDAFVEGHSIFLPPDRVSTAIEATCDSEGLHANLHGGQCAKFQELTVEFLESMSLENVRHVMRGAAESPPLPPVAVEYPGDDDNESIHAPSLRFYVTEFGWRSPLVASESQCQTVWSSRMLKTLERNARRVTDLRRADLVFLDFETAELINWPLHGEWDANYVLGDAVRCHKPKRDTLHTPEHVVWVRESLVQRGLSPQARVVVFDFRGQDDLRKNMFKLRGLGAPLIQGVVIASYGHMDGHSAERDVALMPPPLHPDLAKRASMKRAAAAVEDHDGDSYFVSFQGVHTDDSRLALSTMHDPSARTWVLVRCRDTYALVVEKNEYCFTATCTSVPVLCAFSGENSIGDGPCCVAGDDWDEIALQDYGEMLLSSTFTLVPRGHSRFSHRLGEAVAAGAIPVVISDGLILPFEPPPQSAAGLIDWTDISVRVPEARANETLDILHSIPPERVRDMKRRLGEVYRNYFSTFDRELEALVAMIEMQVQPPVSSSATTAAAAAA